MAWLEKIGAIEALEDCAFDAGLVAAMQVRAANAVGRPVMLSTPTFKEYETPDVKGCGKRRRKHRKGQGGFIVQT